MWLIKLFSLKIGKTCTFKIRGKNIVTPQWIEECREQLNNNDNYTCITGA